MRQQTLVRSAQVSEPYATAAAVVVSVKTHRMESEQQRTWLEPWGTAAAYDILTEAVDSFEGSLWWSMSCIRLLRQL